MISPAGSQEIRESFEVRASSADVGTTWLKGLSPVARKLIKLVTGKLIYVSKLAKSVRLRRAQDFRPARSRVSGDQAGRRGSVTTHTRKRLAEARDSPPGSTARASPRTITQAQGHAAEHHRAPCIDRRPAAFLAEQYRQSLPTSEAASARERNAEEHRLQRRVAGEAPRRQVAQPSARSTTARMSASRQEPSEALDST